MRSSGCSTTLQETTHNLRLEAGTYGIDGKRIIFAEKQPKIQHLARHQHAGLFLDTLFYNAHTTASDSLRVGVPVSRSWDYICLPGCVQPVEGSQSSGDDYHTLYEYEEFAVKLATDNVFLSELREKLVTNLKSSPLFDTPLFARHIETAYEMMWERYSSGKPRGTIIIPR